MYSDNANIQLSQLNLLLCKFLVLWSKINECYFRLNPAKLILCTPESIFTEPERCQTQRSTAFTHPMIPLAQNNPILCLLCAALKRTHSLKPHPCIASRYTHFSQPRLIPRYLYAQSCHGIKGEFSASVLEKITSIFAFAFKDYTH